MPANTNPIFVLTPDRGINGGGRISAINTTRDLSVTTGATIIFSAGTNGSRVDAIDWVHSSTGQTGTSALSVVCVGRLFQCSDTSFSNPRLIREIVLTPATQASTTAIGLTLTMSFTTPLVLPPNYCLVATISVAQNTGGYFDVTVYGGDY
jgi:hypothetical protein